MDREERTIEADSRALLRGLHGNKDLPQGGGREDSMDVMAARDVIVNVNQPPETTAEETLPATETLPPADKPASKSLLQKAAPYLLAATLAGIPGSGVVTYLLTRPDPTPPPAASSPVPGYEYSGRPFTPGEK